MSFIILMVLVVGVGGRVLAERNHPGLMAERMSVGREQDVKSWDRILAPLLGFCLLYPHVIVAGLDHYHGWTKAFPLWVHTIAFVIILLGYLLGAWAIFVNRFFSADMKSVIAGQDHNGIVSMRARIKCIQDGANLVVNERHARHVSLQPLLV